MSSMSIFAILPQSIASRATVKAALDRVIPDVGARYALSDGCWLVSARSTAQQLSNDLQITTGEGGAAIVLEVASYYGRTNPAVWSWIKNNWEANAVG